MEPFARAAEALEAGRGDAAAFAAARTFVDRDRLRSARRLTAGDRGGAASVLERTAGRLKAYLRRCP